MQNSFYCQRCGISWKGNRTCPDCGDSGQILSGSQEGGSSGSFSMRELGEVELLDELSPGFQLLDDEGFGVSKEEASLFDEIKDWDDIPDDEDEEEDF